MTTKLPHRQADTAKQLYDDRANKYDESHHPKFAMHMVEELQLKPGEKVLDLACGTGLVTLTAADIVGPSGFVVGIDVSDGMLKELDNKINADNDKYANVKIYNHDIAALTEIKDLEKGSFDAISCASALVLLPEPVLALCQWMEYLKPGGRLITDVTDANNIPWGTATERTHIRMGLPPPYNRSWAVNAESLSHALRQAGFDIQKTWFKESTGEGMKHHFPSEGAERFENMKDHPMNKALVESGCVEEAKKIFIEEWEKLADKEGKIIETDGVHCAMATKPQPSEPLLQGSCACGSIKWTAHAIPSSSSNCHCVPCRKISGAASITFISVPVNRLHFSPPLGKPFIKTNTVSPYAERQFCGECGSTLTMWYRRRPETISITAGSLDEDRSQKGVYKGPIQHIYCGSIPSWHSVPGDGKPRFDTMRSAPVLLVDEDGKGEGQRA